jgi:dimethylamine--corrinoid protein Co-methyltransferase
MAVMHEMASGMGGIRTAGDLVARMVMKGMRIGEAKKYVAGKLGCDVLDLSDSAKMKEIRESLDIGTVNDRPHASYGMSAKIKIAELLDIKIPSVELFKKKLGKAL